jgi:hypothetical protein
LSRGGEQRAEEQRIGAGEGSSEQEREVEQWRRLALVLLLPLRDDRRTGGDRHGGMRLGKGCADGKMRVKLYVFKKTLI